MATLVLSIVPAVFATSVGTGVGVNIQTEQFKPIVWMCGDRIVSDDNVQPGRNGESLQERLHNYAFEGESVKWTVLVMDKNGAQKIKDVFATIGNSQGSGNNIEANCVRTTGPTQIDPSCNARILEEQITTFNPATMSYYECTLTVETGESMYGEYWVTVEAEDLNGLSGTMDENEYWFFNPIIALSVDGALAFENVRPGTDSYSKTMLIGNDADAGSGVLLDMFISGTDFYDSASSGAACPTTNQLSLEAFSYFATNGAYSTKDNEDADDEGYRPIGYGDHWDASMYNNNEIIHNDDAEIEDYYAGNILSPGSEMALTFKLSMPEPCNGDFDTGSIYFWGEAI
ncbi:MAG: hypothetical protein WC781_05365 [Candidatus Pacearchaeota archaeon]